MSELSDKVLSTEQLRDIDIRLQCVKFGEGDVRMAEGIYKFVTGTETPAEVSKAFAKVGDIVDYWSLADSKDPYAAIVTSITEGRKLIVCKFDHTGSPIILMGPVSLVGLDQILQDQACATLRG